MHNGFYSKKISTVLVNWNATGDYPNGIYKKFDSPPGIVTKFLRFYTFIIMLKDQVDELPHYKMPRFCFLFTFKTGKCSIRHYQI